MTLDLTPQDLSPADAVFIDGDHGRCAVEHDSALAVALMRHPGIIVWHDYHDLGTVNVKLALDSLHHGAGREIFHVEGTWLAFEPRREYAEDHLELGAPDHQRRPEHPGRHVRKIKHA